jgi:hypothetical protein
MWVVSGDAGGIEGMITSVDWLSPDIPQDKQRVGQDHQQGDGFARLLAAVQEVQRYLEALQEENRALHAALDALRSGAGITVIIDGTPFTLRR